MNSFRRLHPGTPLEGRDGMFIIEDRKKWLWMGTSDGLFHYDKNDNFIPYNFVDGIPSSILPYARRFVTRKEISGLEILKDWSLWMLLT